MAEKIKGWADIHIRDGYTEGWFGQSSDDKFPKATLVMGDERVFTESEMRAMLVNITHECGCYDHRGEPVFATRVDDINHIAAKHGIVLDPA
jgi:hypothetical protein